MTEEGFAPRDLGRFVDNLRNEGDAEQIREFLNAVDEIAEECSEGTASEIVEEETAPHRK